MDKALFEKLASEVCISFGTNCSTCPFWGFRKSVDATSCAESWRVYRKEAELVLATWIGGVDFVEALGEHERKKAQVTRREILQAAERCVCVDRDNQYGSPENSFRVIAAFWTQYIMSKCVPKKTIVDIGPDDVAAMMVLFKMARVATGQNKED